MNKYDLSVLIPARNEMFLARTVEGLLKNIRGNTEVIVALDGQWASPGIPDDPRITVIYFPESIGQRAATNQAARLSNAKYVMKLDAHCELDEGFDVKLISEMQDDMTMIPAMYNLHAFDWKCMKCGKKWYQGPTPTYCHKDYDGKTKNPDCDNTTDFKRKIIFAPRLHKKSMYYRFDHDLHFQYWGAYKERPEAQKEVAEILSAQGSCFMLTREKYWELDICDERHGSWGQQGVEVAMKTWLSGGRLVVNKKTWYAHMFRTQGGDFGFPYPLSGNAVEKARQYSKDLWLNDKWDKALPGRNLKWLLNKFAPVPDWEEETKMNTDKGIIFYTDNRVNLKIAHAVQKQLKKTGLPIVSSSLKPMSFGQNIHIPLERGYLTMFKQQLAALEASSAKYIFMCEHDVLYHPSHFEFIPPKDDVFYYNVNVWKVDAKTGFALKVDVAKQVSGICANRQLLIEEYKRRIARIEKEGKFERGWGNEPGTKDLARGGFSDLTSEIWNSEYPNIDIRGDWNLTINRWSKDKYRDKSGTIGWTESTVSKIPGWNFSQDEEFYRHF